MKYKFDFYTQYSQFYLSSDNGSTLTLDSLNWSSDAYNDRLFIYKNMLVVLTECYGHVKGELDILDNANDKIDSNEYDHIVEGGLEIKSGELQILDCPNSKIEFEIKINPGIYRVRIYSSNLASIIDDDGDDYYNIEIWPDNDMERKVLKRYIRK